MDIWLIKYRWLIHLFIALIPVLLIISYEDANEKCKNRWALAAFVLPLLLNWIAKFIVIVVQGGLMPYFYLYKYASVPFWVWLSSAWGMYFYFRYRVKYKGACTSVTPEQNNKKDA